MQHATYRPQTGSVPMTRMPEPSDILHQDEVVTLDADLRQAIQFARAVSQRTTDLRIQLLAEPGDAPPWALQGRSPPATPP